MVQDETSSGSVLQLCRLWFELKLLVVQFCEIRTLSHSSQGGECLEFDSNTI